MLSKTLQLFIVVSAYRSAFDVDYTLLYPPLQYVLPVRGCCSSHTDHQGHRTAERLGQHVESRVKTEYMCNNSRIALSVRWVHGGTAGGGF